MKRILRFIAIAIIPPILGLCIFSLFIDFLNFDQSTSVSWDNFQKDMIFLVKAAFAFSAIPSICIFFSYELIFNRVLKSKTSYILFGALTGFLSSVFMLFLINKQIWLVHPLTISGFITGSLLGYLLYFLRKKNMPTLSINH